MDEQNKVIKILLERGSTDLAGYLKKNPDKITVDFIKMCWKKMLDAVDVVHKAGIIHTDLKPANFLLVEWNLKLIDFGIANAIQVCFELLTTNDPYMLFVIQLIQSTANVSKDRLTT